MDRPVAWQPSAEVVERANVTRLARRMGADDYPQLHRMSVEDPGRFWSEVVEDLGIEFHRPFTRVLDTSAGPEWATWFLGSGVNVAHNCVLRHAGSGTVALIWEAEDGTVQQMRYDELAALVCRFAHALRGIGVHPGDRVGLYMPLTPMCVVAFMGCAMAGAIVVPIFSGFGPDAVASRLQDARAHVLVCADGFSRRGAHVAMKPIADAAVERAGDIHHVIVHRRSGLPVSMTAGRDLDLDELLDAQPSSAKPADTGAEDPLMIAYTSGTTGRPKGAVHVHGGFLVKIAAEVAYQTDYRPGEVLHWVTDIGWIMGPWAVVGTLALGGTLLLYDGAPDHPDPGRLWSLVARHRVAVLGVSPTLVRALMVHGDEHVARHDLSSLRILGSTGEPWNVDPYLWYAQRVGGGRCPVINFSGGTEVGACLLSPTPAMPLKACSLGGPALGMAMDVWGPDGKPVPPGHVGELVCTMPWPGMTRGIWGDPHRYLDTYWSRWPGAWVHGDWASVDADGQWFLHGRSDDTLNVAGKRVGPAEVESLLVADPAVAEAAVVGVPDDVKGEAMWCYVVLAPGHEPSEQLRSRLAGAVVAAMGKAFAPAAVRFAAELPKTRNAKIVRRAVRAVASGTDPGDLSSIENPDALQAIARAV